MDHGNTVLVGTRDVELQFRLCRRANGPASCPLQADTGSSSVDAGCLKCMAWGRDTCKAILATWGVSTWGWWVMAPLVTCASCVSFALALRIASERQVRNCLRVASVALGMEKKRPSLAQKW
jgi:hypothetical protein